MQAKPYAISHLQIGGETLIPVPSDAGLPHMVTADIMRIRDAIYKRGQRTGRRYNTAAEFTAGKMHVRVRRIS